MTSSLPPVAVPASYVPVQALAFGALGDPAVVVTAADPLPVADRAFRGAVPLAPGAAAVTPGRAVAIDCSVAGRVVLALADGSTLSVPVEAGLSILPFAVTGIVTAGTTATAGFASLL